MELVATINNAVNRVVWGPPMLLLLVGVGILLTFRTRGMQLRHFGHAMKNTVGRVFHPRKAGEGEVTPFQAMTTALAGTVGTGSIAGITSAITLGGPGALFWLWVTALIGMVTKFAEVLLAVKFRERNPYGDWTGGPMYYIKHGLGKRWGWLASLFCVFAALAAFGTGNTVQVGNITSSINTVILTFRPDFTGQDTVNLVLGIFLALLTAVVLFGGVKRLGAVTETLVPAMALLYMAACLVVILTRLPQVPGVLQDVFVGAFSPGGVTGGAVGSLSLAAIWGIKRGVFSNEAGLGTAPMAHATTSETDPVKQGFFGIFEVFSASIVICTLTGLSLLCSGIPLTYGVMGDTSLNAAALGTVFTSRGGAILIALGLSLFAFSTVLSWALYGSRCCEFLFGAGSIRWYQAVYVLMIVVGATIDLGLAWDLADTLNGLMALPNLIALVGLSGVVVRETRDYFDRRRHNQT